MGPTVQLGPEGLTFDTPVKVTLPWDGGSVPVVIAHSPRGGSDWTPLDFWNSDETHVWAETTSFSWFQPVYYQGSSDAPIVLENDRPVSPEAVALDQERQIHLFGTGFRTDTVVTIFKDGVATMDVTDVTLRRNGLTFTLPQEFVETVGLITIQAKNPQAAVGDATAIYSIATPVLSSLSPTSVPVDGAGPVGVAVTVDATDLPADLSLCRIDLFRIIGPDTAAPATTSELNEVQDGFSFDVSEIQFVEEHDVRLICGGAVSNELVIDFVESVN